VSRSGLTVNDGVFSAWNGQRPLKIVPARLSATVSPTTSATASFDLISATMPLDEDGMTKVSSGQALELSRVLSRPSTLF
jgi:hypothetical protein